MLDHVLVSVRCWLYSHTEIHDEVLQYESLAFANDVKDPESHHDA